MADCGIAKAAMPAQATTVEITMVEAINLALARELERDPDVVLLGEDIGANGGVFRATVGLQARFGAERVLDTPLAESGIAGMAIGMAAEGLKPVLEIQFSGFIYPALDHIINHASRLRNRTRGRLSCPMVLRTPCGAGIHAPEHHSESPEALLAHVLFEWSCRPHRFGHTGCCSRRYATRTRSCSWSPRACTACSGRK
jgi:pyruvate dehydrogenase E1 component beta subunit